MILLSIIMASSTKFLTVPLTGSPGSMSLSRDSPARLSTRLTVAGETPTSIAM